MSSLILFVLFIVFFIASRLVFELARDLSRSPIIFLLFSASFLLFTSWASSLCRDVFIAVSFGLISSDIFDMPPIAPSDVLLIIWIRWLLILAWSLLAPWSVIFSAIAFVFSFVVYIILAFLTSTWVTDISDSVKSLGMVRIA